MGIVYSDSGRAQWLRYLLGKSHPGDILVKLWVNNFNPQPASAIGAFDEMDGHGYEAIVVARSSWTVAEVNDTTTSAAAPPVTWTFTSGSAVNVYGYVIVGADGSWLLAERFNAPFLVQEAGTTITVSLAWLLSSPPSA